MNLTINLPSSTPRSIPVHSGPGMLAQLPELLIQHTPAHRYALITDSQVEELYGKQLLAQLNEKGLHTELFSFPAGEASKNEETKQSIDHALLQRGYGRDTVIIALGGGVVGDLAGYVAATYLRGIPFVQVPTTVLAMVDSSIGGKVGVDTPFGKNMIGAFWQPSLIVADTDVLKTLTPEQVQNGWFEAIKMFVCMDKNAYEAFKAGPTDELLQRAMELKIQVIQADERESNLRSILNYGHSVGHALELLSQYTLPHGFAIALGMVVEGKVSVGLGYLMESDWHDLRGTLDANGLTLDALKNFAFEDVWKALQSDKKNTECEVRMVLLESLGAVKKVDGKITHNVQKNDLEDAWASITDPNSQLFNL